MRTPALIAAALALVAAAADAADYKTGRRDREDPELVIETGGRMAACDDLRFTPDGKRLLAVGDDKVVRVWSYENGGIDPASVRVLRWGVWREQRGTMYALAVSPDSRRVAVGGLAVTSPAAILDLDSGRILDTIFPTIENGGAVWSLAFSPSGKRLAIGGGDGSVWLWDGHAVARLGRHAGDARFNIVRLLHFTDEGHLLSLAEDGQVLKWDVDAGADGKPAVALDLKLNAPVYRARFSPDGRTLAVAPKSPVLALRSLDGSQSSNILLKENQFVRSLAFDPANNRLAAAVGFVPPGKGFQVEADDRLVFYDLDGRPPQASPGPPHAYRAEALAFPPGGGALAVAGGENQEVTLWDLSHAEKPASVLRGTGSCLWDVALSDDGRAVGFRDQRDPASVDPEARGRGPWRAFDLTRRQWTAAADFKPVARLTTAGGWTIEPDAHDPYVWYAVHGAGTRLKLPLDRDRDGMPRCWTFLEAQEGAPVRLAVGHYWGFSVFELTTEAAKRTRLCVGHQGEVLALAPSADGAWIVSCSNDMTLAAWNLAKTWPSQPIIGASFEPKGAGLMVKAVDAGSPAWEAGLVPGDEVTRFAFAGQWLKDDPAAWQKRLADPVPGLEHAFELRRGDRKEIVLTTLKQRPLWRFFPSGDDEWVLWMWRNNFYDTSTKGDYAVGWHLNAADPKGSPTFYRAERFRKFLHRADVINRLLKSRDASEALSFLGDNPVPLHFDGMEPPAAALALGAVAPGKDVEATLSAYARGENPDEIPSEAMLWVNDYRLPLTQSDVQKWAKEGRSATLKLTIPYNRLRAGRNVVTFQAWNRLGGRTDAAGEVVCDRPAPAAPRLIGLAVGINDYKASRPSPDGKGAVLGNLEDAVNDARELSQAWAEQKLYGGKEMTTLTDADATRQRILDALDALARTARPDDQCIVSLSGHGDFRAEPPERPGEAPREVFVFCLPDYDPAHPYQTGLTNEVLFEKLAAIPCRKLLILDACRSGAAANPVRGFAPDGQGPVVMAGCDLNQSSLENEQLFHHGLFTFAILEALNDQSAYRSADGARLLYVEDLYNYTRKKMPRLLGLIGRKETAQVPILFAPEDENFPVARRD